MNIFFISKLCKKHFMMIVSRSLPLHEYHPKSGQTASAVTTNGSVEGDYDNLWQEEKNEDMYAKVGDAYLHTSMWLFYFFDKSGTT